MNNQVLIYTRRYACRVCHAIYPVSVTGEMYVETVTCQACSLDLERNKVMEKKSAMNLRCLWVLLIPTFIFWWVIMYVIAKNLQ